MPPTRRRPLEPGARRGATERPASSGEWTPSHRCAPGQPGGVRGALVGLVIGAAVLAACASDDGPASGSLDADAARDRLATACADTSTRLDGLAEPIDDAQRPAWTREVAAILRDEAATVSGLTLLDAEQRDGFRAFADNTSAQADAWNDVADLLASGVDLSGDPRLGDLTTEIAELSLGRDELSDELGVSACRRR